VCGGTVRVDGLNLKTLHPRWMRGQLALVVRLSLSVWLRLRLHLSVGVGVGLCQQALACMHKHAAVLSQSVSERRRTMQLSISQTAASLHIFPATAISTCTARAHSQCTY
jgi:hypothetical protein